MAHSRSGPPLLGFALSSALAAAALASEGVLEINQTCALASTGCFPGDAGGSFPVTLSRRGSYRLTSNLVLPTASTTGIEIAADSVVLDLAGFEIDGPTVCTGAPVASCTPLGAGVGVLGGSLAVVKNGTVSGVGDDGVRLGFSSRAEGLLIFHSGGDGLVLDNENIARGNIVTGNGAQGIRCNSNCVVSENTVTGNGSNGIVVPSGTVNGNSANLNGGRGGLFGVNTSFAHNTFIGNVTPDASGGHASGGNMCGDRSCSARGARRFYLTPAATFTGAEAPTACAVAFHFASLWELFDVAVLEYDPTRGQVLGDSLRGPPSGATGWVRTGVAAETAQSAGSANCAAWASASASAWGTVVALDSGWADGNSPFSTDNPPWIPIDSPCNNPNQVWCVED